MKKLSKKEILILINNIRSDNMAFEQLGDKLQSILKKVKGQSRLKNKT